MVWSDAPHGGFTTGEPWLPVKGPQAARCVAAQAGLPGSVLETYRALLAFRRGRPELISGDIAFGDGDAAVLSFVRRADGRALRCLFNLTGEEQPVGRPIAPIGPCAAVEGERLGPWGFAFEEVG